MLTRRRFRGYSALTPAMLAYDHCLGWDSNTRKEAVASVIGTSYSLSIGWAMQTIADRFLVGYPYEGEWRMLARTMQVVSMYLDARPHGGEGVHGVVRTVPEDRADLSEGRAKEFGFRLCNNIPEALRCGGTRLAVDAVLCVVEQDDYPRNHKDQVLYPRYDFFQQCVQVFEEERRAVPYFNHENLSFSYPEAKSMVEASERLKFPLLAGSSLPVTYRIPEVDIPLGAKVVEAVMVGVGTPDGMDFDALEAMQAMLERRAGGRPV